MVGSGRWRDTWGLGALAGFLFTGLWSSRTGASGDVTRDLAPSIGAAWIVGVAVWWIARRASQDRGRAFLLGALGILWCALSGSAAYWLLRLVGPANLSSGGAAALWTLAVVALGWAIARARGNADRLAEATATGAVIALALTVANAVVGRAARTPSAPAAWTDARTPGTPDVYLIVLDMHVSGAWLAKSYGYDARPFEDSLRRLGFVVPEAARANYAHTQLSLPSLLAGRLLQDDSAMASTPVAALPALVAASPLWPAVKSRGYRLAFFATPYEATRSLPAADLAVHTQVDSQPPMAETFRLHAPFAAWMAARPCAEGDCAPGIKTPFPIESAPALERKFHLLASLPDSAGPIWAFAHVLAPHQPYLYDDGCGHRQPWWPLQPQRPGLEDAIRSAYRAQVRCVDSLVLDAVTRILARSPTRPVILITGDHGFGRIGVDVLRGITLEHSELTTDQVAERMSVFTALLLPGADTLLGDSPSLVELLPAIRRSLWRDSTPLPKNAPSYFSPYHRLMDFTEVPAGLLRAPPRDSTR